MVQLLVQPLRASSDKPSIVEILISSGPKRDQIGYRVCNHQATEHSDHLALPWSKIGIDDDGY